MEVCPGILKIPKNCIRLRQFSFFGPQSQNCVENFLKTYPLHPKLYVLVFCFFMLTVNLAWLLSDKSSLRRERLFVLQLQRVQPPWGRHHATTGQTACPRQGRCRGRGGGWPVASALRKLSVDGKWGVAMKPQVPPAPNPIF